MPKRVTLQDIADSLNLSRNTVSKAINNSPVVAEATKKLIFERAAEMGYKQFSYFGAPDSEPAVNPNGPREIALLTEYIFGNSHFGTFMIDRIQSELSRLGYSFTIYRVMPDDIKANRLPASFDTERIAGIICIELFNYDYCQMVCSLNIPTISVDAPVALGKPPLKTDKILMENYNGIFNIICELKNRGIKRIGFVGDALHCRSFYERYMAYYDAIGIFNLDFDRNIIFTTYDDAVFPEDEKPSFSYLEKDSYHYYLEKWLDNIKQMPECIICANDFVALDLISSLNKRNIRIPDDLLLAGFDDSQESRLMHPKLTTVHIHSQSMGVTAVEMLLSRMKEPELAYRTVYVESEVIFRASTGD